MWYFVIYGSATLLGLVIGVISAASVYARLTTRLKAHNSVLQTAIELENRRDAYDYGRVHEVRPNAGDPVRISNLAVTRPGAMTLHHMGIDSTGQGE